MKIILMRLALVLLLTAGLASTLPAQRYLGALEGRITDLEGFPLPGAFIYLSSPALIGIFSYITADTGYFIFPELAPGRYKITVEMPGFKTVNVEDISVHSGLTAITDVRLESSSVEEEVTQKDLTRPLSLKSTSATTTVDRNLLNRIPVSRSLSGILSLVPGFVSEEHPYEPGFSVHGSTVRANTFSFDGFLINDPVSMTPSLDIPFDTVEEVEVRTTGHPITLGATEGGYIHIVTKPGGNKVRAALFLGHSGESLSKILWERAELADLGAAAPPVEQSFWDTSFSFGGPVLSDRAWFFSSTRFLYRGRKTSFFPWVDPQEKFHEKYAWNTRELGTFFRFSGNATSQIRFGGGLGFQDRFQPVAEFDPPPNQTREAAHVLDHERLYYGRGSALISVDRNTFIDLNAGVSQHTTPFLLNKETTNNPRYEDALTGHLWGSADVNEKRLNKKLQAGALIRRIQDGLFLSSRHELQAGGEYEQSSLELSSWKENNLLLTYLNGNPYFYGLVQSPSTGNTVGNGRVSFYTTGRTEGGLATTHEYRRLSFFLQETALFARRLTLSLGLRFDRSMVSMPSFSKSPSGNPVSVDLGDKLIMTVFDLNPYDANAVPEWPSMVVWNAWSPRAGLSLDVFGNGKTALKASFARYAEYLSLQYSLPLAPFLSNLSHEFAWFDENMDGLVDSEDTFTLTSDDFRMYDPQYYRARLNPGLKPPYTSELMVGLEQEISKDFTLSLRFLSKSQSNIIDSVLYSPDLDQEWYNLTETTKAWWVPFRTIVPSDSHPETPVTVYFRSKNAPLLFDRLTNVPELKRSYQAAEFSFWKRMAQNRQLAGSVVWSRAKGNIGLAGGPSSGFAQAVSSPNFFTNLENEALLDMDRPLRLKLMGTYGFPYDFHLSFFYSYSSGKPWARSVVVRPPSSWAEKNQADPSSMAVLLEAPGSRRFPAQSNLDLRVEKEFNLRGEGRFRVYLDIINALGNKYSLADDNDGGFWFPDAENTSQGRRVLSPNYGKTLLLAGVRSIRLNLNLAF